MTKKEMGRTIDAVEDVMLELEVSSPQLRSEVMVWLNNLRVDIESFLKEYNC